MLVYLYEIFQELKFQSKWMEQNQFVQGEATGQKGRAVVMVATIITDITEVAIVAPALTMEVTALWNGAWMSVP